VDATFKPRERLDWFNHRRLLGADRQPASRRGGLRPFWRRRRARLQSSGPRPGAARDLRPLACETMAGML